MPETRHRLKHPARLYVALMLLFYDEYGDKNFDTFDGEYLRKNNIKAHEIAINIKGLGLKKVLIHRGIPKQEIPAFIGYVRSQVLRDDLIDIFGIGPTINKALKHWVAAGMPDQSDLDRKKAAGFC